MCKGDNVSWHLIGGPGGMHTATFHGNTFLRNGNNHDTLGMSEGQLREKNGVKVVVSTVHALMKPELVLHLV